ncbi:LpxL/LpxP family Kdo(2)-lipid IV(A) lauroyl/palmitoleoyl acyltransferase [Shewanella sp. NIFS-20-20]|uniref:LpxL/LpxP family Kdo(2)-lipid IV(A) lauroyl/palmitoleoyl acyltransferase n=1 Tax=Shewanella sp. NIFS-20-20 TaxID=2853806 RepID=UPI001C48C47B|nr:LpxL/LpxP family Kdo(2)-lipid IV(A) lauroyl/palmitoleoyl acyltransferase [Shewanella sp. NIFS-20-20]MBV7314166.1 LpxL/LpxP family Kdo(2)-lipid IV(A) lauroyl/palmitoleoyl acyltransferase [Shewanella sp. NIFS-20-20]
MSKYTAPQFTLSLLHPRYWGTLLIIGIMFSLSLLPYSWQFRLGQLCGRFAIRWMPKRQRTIERNLSLCFPNMSDKERAALVKLNIDNTGLALFETGMAWFWSDKRVLRHVDIVGLRHLQALAAEGKGVMLLAVHSLNLELAARAFGIQMSGMGVYRPNNNPCFDYFQYRGRSRSNRTLIDRKNIKCMLDSLRQGARVWYAPDHDYGRRRSTFAPLFAVDKACTTTGTSILVEETDCAIVSFSMVRQHDSGRYVLTFNEPLIDAYPKGDEVAAATFVNGLVEQAIMAAPSQYMWLHRRFKTRPEGEPSLY